MHNLKLITMRDVEAEQIRFLWKPYIAYGKITSDGARAALPPLPISFPLVNAAAMASIMVVFPSPGSPCTMVIFP